MDVLYADHVMMQVRFRAGQAEVADRFYTEMIDRCAAVSESGASEAELSKAQVVWALGHHREALSLASSGLARMKSFGSVLFAELTRMAAEAEIALGEWDAATARLERARVDLD